MIRDDRCRDGQYKKRNVLDFIHILKFFESVTDQGSIENQSLLLCELIACDPPLPHPPEKTIVPNLIYTWFFENRVSKDKDSFYYLAIKNNKIRPKGD